jgi:hypothetical protein
MLLILFLIASIVIAEPLPELGEAFAIAPNPTDNRAQLTPAMAYDSLNKIFLLVWQQGEDYFEQDSADLYAARLDSNGVLIDQTPMVICNATGTQESPKVSWQNGCFLVVWHDLRSGTDWDVYGARVTATGQVQDVNGFLIASGANSQCAPAITLIDTSFLVIWQGTDSIGFYRANATTVKTDGTIIQSGAFRYGTSPLNGGKLAIIRVDTLWYMSWYDEKCFYVGGPSLRKFARLVMEDGNFRLIDVEQGPAGMNEAGLFGKEEILFGGDGSRSAICATMDGVGHAGLQIAHAVIFNKDSLKAQSNPNDDNHTASSYDNKRIILLYSAEEEFNAPVAAAYGQGRYMTIAQNVSELNKLYAQRLYTDGTKLDNINEWAVVHSGDYPVSTPALCSDGEKFVLAFQQDGGFGAQTILVKVVTLPPDTIKPSVVMVSLISDTTLLIMFSEVVNSATANNLSGYLLTPSITISSVSLQSDGKTVLLSTSHMQYDTQYTLTVSGVSDIAKIPNIMDNHIASFVFLPPYKLPLFHWKLDDENGIAATDASGNNNTATLYGNTAWIQGKLSGGISLDGMGDYLSTSLQQANPQVFTLSMWFKTTSTALGKIIGFSNTQTGISASYDREILVDASGKVSFRVFNGTAIEVTSTDSYNDGSWHHALSTISASGMALYIDGVLAGSNQNNTAESYNGYWRIGCNSSANYFNGQLDDIRIYGTALMADQIDLVKNDTTYVEGYKTTIYSRNKDALDVFPNPFNPSVTISLHGTGALNGAIVSIYDISGLLVKNLQTNSDGVALWIASSMPSGVYIVKATLSGKVLLKKLSLLK